MEEIKRQVYRLLDSGQFTKANVASLYNKLLRAIGDNLTLSELRLRYSIATYHGSYNMRKDLVIWIEAYLFPYLEYIQEVREARASLATLRILACSDQATLRDLNNYMAALVKVGKLPKEDAALLDKMYRLILRRDKYAALKLLQEQLREV